MEYTGIVRNKQSGGFFGVLAVLAFLTAGFFVVAYAVSEIPSEHALARHGGEALAAHKCINDGGTMHGTFTRQSDGRKTTICEIEGFFYLYVEEATGEEVTSLLKNKMRRLEQVLQYLRNGHYEIPIELLPLP